MLFFYIFFSQRLFRSRKLCERVNDVSLRFSVLCINVLMVRFFEIIDDVEHGK